MAFPLKVIGPDNDGPTQFPKEDKSYGALPLPRLGQRINAESPGGVLGTDPVLTSGQCMDGELHPLTVGGLLH